MGFHDELYELYDPANSLTANKLKSVMDKNGDGRIEFAEMFGPDAGPLDIGSFAEDGESADTTGIAVGGGLLVLCSLFFASCCWFLKFFERHHRLNSGPDTGFLDRLLFGASVIGEPVLLLISASVIVVLSAGLASEWRIQCRWLAKQLHTITPIHGAAHYGETSGGRDCHLDAPCYILLVIVHKKLNEGRLNDKLAHD